MNSLAFAVASRIFINDFLGIDLFKKFDKKGKDRKKDFSANIQNIMLLNFNYFIFYNLLISVFDSWGKFPSGNVFNNVFANAHLILFSFLPVDVF